VFGAVDAYEIDKTYRKLSSVCDQFLHMTASLMGAIEPADDLAEFLVTYVASNSGTSAAAPHWDILSQMTSGSTPQTPVALAAITQPARPIMRAVSEVAEIPEPIPEPKATVRPTPAPKTIATMPDPVPAIASTPHDDTDSIVDLPNADASPVAIISAVVRGSGDLIETPIKSPACPDASVAVSRDHRLVLVAVAGNGLTGLGGIASAYRWMNENRQLIAMALPQCSIDTHARAKLDLLVDHADSDAQQLQPLLESGFVTVRAYRKLRWAGKTGLLLEAA
jgi:hypothetical protein